MKAKTNMEGKYIKKCAEVAVAQSQKKCFISEKEMKEEIEVYTALQYNEIICIIFLIILQLIFFFQGQFHILRQIFSSS